jgi:hypothetical protein
MRSGVAIISDEIYGERINVGTRGTQMLVRNPVLRQNRTALQMEELESSSVLVQGHIRTTGMKRHPLSR